MAMKNKNAVIIGGCGGIGLAICEKFLSEGIENLAAIDILEREEAIKRFTSPKIVYKKCRADNKSQLQMTLEEIRKTFNYIDILINTAGVAHDDNAELMVAINYMGMVNSTMTGIDLMRKNGVGRGGFIINLSSTTALTPFLALQIYSGTKAAVLGFTRALSGDVLYKETGISFMTICPGKTETPILAASRMPREIEPFVQSFCQSMILTLPSQQPSAVADCFFKAISEGENGDVWRVEDGKIEKIPMQFSLLE